MIAKMKTIPAVMASAVYAVVGVLLISVTISGVDGVDS